MATELFMPKAGMDMQEGKIVRWLKNVGDRVEFEEAVMEIETDKITMESESPVAGILLAKLFEDGAVVPVLQTIGYIGEAGEQVPTTAAPAPGTADAEAPSNVLVSTPPEAPAAAVAAPVKGDGIAATPYAKKLASEKGVALSDVTPTGRHGEVIGDDVLRATPLAQKIAADKGVDLSSVAGSGFGGKVTKDDVLAAAATGAPVVGDRKALSGMRKVIAERMLASHQQIPVVTQNMKVNMGNLLELRATINTGRETKISINDFVLKAVAKAVSEFPVVRTVLDGNELVTKKETNIGFAVGLEEGLLVPVIRDADKLSLSQISAQAKDLAGKARNGGLRPDDYTGGTFTISNLGMFDVHSFTPIINQPEAGILGVCAINDELALVDGNVVVNKIMMLSLTFDHRIMDGVGAAKFQLRIRELLENPMEILV